MFEVGFQELVVIFGVSLVVLGPKRLPGLVNKVGRWVGKARSMARDFRQQLENEVNLEELNKMTELQTRQASPQTPAPPPEFSGEPLPEPASPPTYPYSAPDNPQTDDTFSHAHAEGGAPMPYEPEPALVEPEAIADSAVPTQADLDLSPPDESHLPPDDARRST